MALSIIALMAFAVGASLVAVLKTEQAAQRSREAGFVIQRLSAEHFIGGSPSNAVEQVSEWWTIQSELGEALDEARPYRWRTWLIQDKDQQAPPLRVSLHEVAITP